jgi:hypothetical protein
MYAPGFYTFDLDLRLVFCEDRDFFEVLNQRLDLQRLVVGLSILAKC